MKTSLQGLTLPKMLGFAFASAAVSAVFLSSILSAHADAAPVITTTIRNASETVITTATLGSSVHAVTTVASTTGAIPTGTVEFSVYPSTTCTGTAVTQSGVALVNGNATSSASVVGATGLSYKVHYNGDANNIASDENCKPLAVTANAPVLTSTLSTTTPVLVGSTAFDSTVLTNVTANAGGSVAYVIYTDAACTIPLQGAGVKTVTNGVVPNSDTIQFNSPGTYRFQAVYSGDANNSIATSTCAGAILTVTAAPVTKFTPIVTTTLSTTTSVLAGSSVSDSAVLTNMSAAATGTVAYTVYSDNACTTIYQTVGTVNVTNGVVPNSASVVFNTPGTYYWKAAYSGDQNNNPATNVCGSEILTVVANPVATAHLIVDKVTVPAADATSFSFTTSGAGYAAFSLTDAAAPNNQTLVPGTYTVAETALAGWTTASALCSKNGAASTTYTQGSAITLATNDSVTCVFTNTKNATSTPGSASLSGTVYSDANKSGVKDSGEVGIAGFTINLYQGAGWSGPTNKAPFKTIVTDANGGYSFAGLADGIYSIEEINQSAWKQFTSDYNSITVTNGVSQSGFDIGNVAAKGAGNGTGGCAKHNDGDDDEDDNDCSGHSGKGRGHGIFRFNNHDNGFHIGWSNGKGNSGKHGGKSGKDD